MGGQTSRFRGCITHKRREVTCLDKGQALQCRWTALLVSAKTHTPQELQHRSYLVSSSTCTGDSNGGRCVCVCGRGG